jgi:hypothetical protein
MPWSGKPAGNELPDSARVFVSTFFLRPNLFAQLAAQFIQPLTAAVVEAGDGGRSVQK